MEESNGKAQWLLVLVTVIAAGGWLFSKEALTGMPPLFFLGTRFLLAGVILLVFYPQGLKLLKPVKTAAKTAALGLLMSIALLSWIQGLDKSEHLGEGAFINSLGFIFIPVISWLLFREQVSLSHWLSLPVAVTGLALLSLESGFSLQIGQLYFLLGSLLIALHFTLVSRLAARIPAITLAGAQLSIVGIAGLAASAQLEVWPSQISYSILGWFLASTFIATSLRFGLQTYAQGFAPASHVALIMILEPIWTAVFASIWFGETMTVLQFVGCCLIFCALLISRWQWCRKVLQQVRGKQYL